MVQPCHRVSVAATGVTLPEPSTSEPLVGNSSKIAGWPPITTPALKSTAPKLQDGEVPAGRGADGHSTPTAEVADMVSKASPAKLREEQKQAHPPRPERLSDRKGAALLGLPFAAVVLIALLWWKLRGPKPHLPATRFQPLPTQGGER